MTRDSRWVPWGSDREASNPGPPRTRARARMEQEAEVALTGLESAIARIDDSSDDEPLMPTWMDEVSPCAEVGRGVTVKQLSFLHCWIHWDQRSFRIRLQETWVVTLMMNAVQHVQSLVGARWRTLEMTKSPIGA